MAKALVVDDDRDFARVTTEILEKAVHGVVSAVSGAKALKTMRPEAPCVVSPDIMMTNFLVGLDVSREMAGDPELQPVLVTMATSLTGV